MPRFKVKLVTTIECPATCEIELEAETEEEARDKALTVYADLEEKHDEARAVYRRQGGAWPKPPFSWEVDSDDVDNNVDSNELEVDEIEEIEA